MLFTVEVPLAGNFAEQMNNMRTYLDHLNTETIAFRRAPGGWQVDFESEREAREFARAFYGHMLSPA
jgi:hypothetical protein